MSVTSKKSRLKLIKGIPSKNPRNFDSEMGIDQYLGSLGKGTKFKQKPHSQVLNSKKK